MHSTVQLTLEDARRVAAAARAKAVAEGWHVVIAIVDAGAHLIYLERADGTQLGSVEVAQAKARSAILFKRPTKAFEDAVQGGRTVLLSLPGATPIEGGLPLVAADGSYLGAIGVSGVLSSQDGQIAAAGVAAL
ncbi:heme-binding protein [Inhella sp.]|uniref:GlcG/HbpS family heme-binding protein n=1 Tax=Inhella sp. TaxID=1921806 RepID=UPI0035AE0FD6